MKRTLSLIFALIMLISAIPTTVYAVGDKEVYADRLLDGLSDPNYTKTTKNYDGYRFKAGTKCTWDCKLYTLTANATKVSGSVVTFNVAFKTKIPFEYFSPSGWCDYEVKVYSNTIDGYDSFRPSEKSSMNFTVNTSKKDKFDFTSNSGMQYFLIKVEKNEESTYDDVIGDTVYSSNPYEKKIEDFANSSERREVYPGNGAFNRFSIYDTWGLGYYIKPDYAIFTSNYRVTKNSITLGNYAFESVVEYRKKGTKKWKKKTFAKNSKMVLKGLKANTTYQIHPLCKIYYTDPETKQKKYVIDQVASPFYLTTVITKKPKVTSIKISKIKYGKKTIPAHWEDHANQPSVWRPTEKLNTASYTITVKVKSVPKNVKGLYLKIGGSGYFAKGNKTTYTFNDMYQDKKKVKGKKIKASFAYSSNAVGKSALGIGPAKKATYKIKKGTYKVK